MRYFPREVERPLRLLAFIPGVGLLFLGLSILAVVAACGTRVLCSPGVGAYGLGPGEWGGFFVALGVVMLGVGVALAPTRSPAEVKPTPPADPWGPDLRLCPACGGRTSVTFRFCQNCGRPLAAL
jgi:hypothetical protein